MDVSFFVFVKAEKMVTKEISTMKEVRKSMLRIYTQQNGFVAGLLNYLPHPNCDITYIMFTLLFY